VTTTVIGATGKVGSAVVRRLLAAGQPVRGYVRDPDKARRLFGQPDGLEIRAGRLDDPGGLAAGLDGASCVFMALGSDGAEGHLQRAVIGTAALILAEPAAWGTHHDLTGPVLLSWPDAMALLSAELGYPVSFETLPERQFLARLTEAGVAPGPAELLITREWAIRAGENERLTATFRELTGHAPGTVAEFLHDNRQQFLPPAA
jgi:uncharacterized protein YbjT (DUF2867 family)